MTLRIAGSCLLLLSTLTIACAQSQEATNDARATEAVAATAPAAADAAEVPATAATAAEPTEVTPPAAAAAEPVPAETAAADAAEETDPAQPPAAEEKKSKKKDRACEEVYVNSRLPQKTCKK